MSVTKWVLVSLAIAGCAERLQPTRPSAERPVQPPVVTPQSNGVVLPPGVSTSASFLVRKSHAALAAGLATPISFHLIDADFDPVDLDDVQVKLRYTMPEVPEVGELEAVPSREEEGLIEAPFQPSRPGKWKIRVILEEEGEPTEEVVFLLTVP